jgi:hypothetical protein
MDKPPMDKPRMDKLRMDKPRMDMMRADIDTMRSNMGRDAGLVASRHRGWLAGIHDHRRP